MTATSIKRPLMSLMYLKKQVNNYMLLHPKADVKKVTETISVIIKEKFKDRFIINVIIENGEYVLKKTNLSDFVNTTTDKVITPSGSIYVKSDVNESVTSQMINTRIEERDAAKLAGFEAKQLGDDLTALTKHFEQSNKKINLNALPGSFNSQYNSNYDRGNYNAITSLGRAIIKCSYTICEQLLGASFHWDGDDAVVNYIGLQLGYMPTDQVIMNIVNTYGLKIPTVEELVEFIRSTVKKYTLRPGIPMTEKIVNNLSEVQRIFIYYANNLKHLIWNNESIFRPVLNKLFNFNLRVDNNIDPNELLSKDGDTLTMVCTNAFEILRYKDKDGEIKNSTLPDLVKYRPDDAKKLLTIVNHVESHLTPIWDIVKVLILTEASVPNIQNKQNTVRNTTTGSDTDSVIFSCHKWVEWYTGEPVKTTKGLYEISSACIYWLVKAIVPMLHKFSLDHGATFAKSSVMKMKNEFLQPIFIGFDIKKQYGSIVTVVEGNVLVKPKLDIKGLGLKSSNFTVITQELIDDILINDILKGAQQGRISGRMIIDKCVKREYEIKDNIENGGVDFFKPLSAKPRADYKKPFSTSYAYAYFWNEVFSKRYGVIELPSKPIMVTLRDPDPKYLKWLEETYPKTYKLMEQVVDSIWEYKLNADDGPIPKAPKNAAQKWKALPSKLAIGGQYGKIPEEIIPLVHTRDIIFQNMNPIYVILKSLSIDTYTSKSANRLTLLSDQY